MRGAIRVACGVALMLGVLVASGPSASAAPSVNAGIQASACAVIGDQPIWGEINPPRHVHGWTVACEDVVVMCKRWGMDQRWWYWVRFELDGLTGYIPASATNIPHSYIDACS